MSLNGIDISGHQKGIKISALDPSPDFVIVKATQGDGFVSDAFEEQAEETLSLNKLLGIYHYAEGTDPKKEAEHFLSVVSKYKGEAIFFLDWESYDNAKFNTGQDKEWITKWCNIVEASMNTNVVVYVSKAYIHLVPLNYEMWIAQYANKKPVYGFQSNPWNEGSYDCLIRQYASTGRLNGYNGNLDLDKFYGTIDDWKIRAATLESSEDLLTYVADTMKGSYGNGETRKKLLGDMYDEVQEVINHVAFSSAETLAKEVWTGAYGNGEVRKAVLGNRYDEVQKIVNEMASK